MSKKRNAATEIISPNCGLPSFLRKNSHPPQATALFSSVLPSNHCFDLSLRLSYQLFEDLWNLLLSLLGQPRFFAFVELSEQSLEVFELHLLQMLQFSLAGNRTVGVKFCMY